MKKDISARDLSGLYDLFLRSAGVSTDSREIIPGTLFFALKGQNFDGNRYAADALDKGACYAVVDDMSLAGKDSRLVVVEDSLKALQSLANHHRKKLGIPVLAITGTNGKTTTKELTAAVLSAKFNVAATRGNLNNQIGVPLTLLSIGSDATFAIVEMGAGAEGEIATLCNIAEPDFGIITNIGIAHLAGFDSSIGVIKTKGELYDYLDIKRGTVFYEHENDLLESIISKYSRLNQISYSVELADGMDCALFGEYNRHNIAAAVAIGQHFQISEQKISKAISGYNPDNHRSQLILTRRNSVLLDCYNANPSSMRAAIESFGRSKSELEKTVILGDMLELGLYADQYHKLIIDLVHEKGFENAFFVGENFYRQVNYSPNPSFNKVKTRFFSDKMLLARYLGENPIEGQFVLLKGSRGIGLEGLIEKL